MAESRNSFLSKLAAGVTSDGDISSDAIAPSVTQSLGTSVYDSASLLPIVGNTAGDTAFVKSTSRLYIHSGLGWYNVAVINNTPTVQSILDSNGGTTPFVLSSEGAVTTITITAQDSDGDPLTYNYSADSDFSGLATLSQDANVFTITPFSQDSATTTSGTITFSVTDGINTATPAAQTFALNFLSALWDEAVLSIGTSSTNSLGNSTFVDRSTNAHTVTTAGTPTQTAFHPYLDKWSVEFDGSSSYIHHNSGPAMDTDVFTWEAWIWWDGSADGTVLATDTNPSNSGPIAMTLTSAGKLDFARHYYGNTQSTALVPANEWTHIAVERSGSTVNLYIDGTQEVKSVGASEDYDIDGYYIGQYIAGDRKFPGYISNVRIVRGSLVYNTSSFTPSSAPLTAITGTELLTCQSNRFIDNSSNGYSLAVYGTPKVSAFNPFGQGSEYAVGENRGSVVLEGSSSYLKFPVTSFTGDYTLECWVYKRDSDKAQVWGAVYPTDGNYQWFIGTNNKLDIYPTSMPSTGSIRLNEWVHLVYQRRSGTLEYFINGVKDAVTTSSNTTSRNLSAVGGSGLGQLDGYIADAKATIGSAVYTSNFTPPVTPVGGTSAYVYIPMDNAGIFDKTGNHTINPNSVVTQTGDTVYASSTMSFNGSTFIRLESPLHQILDNEEFTLEFHVKITENENRNCIFGIGDHSTNDLSFFCQDNGQYKLHPYSSYSTAYNALWDDNWHHFAISRSSGTLRAFIDGTVVASHASTDDYGTTAQVLNIGYLQSFGGYQFQGYIENFQFIRGVAKYTANFTPPTSTQGREYQAED